MAEVDIPLFNGVYKNIDESVSSDKNWEMIDGILDKERTISTRPGLSLGFTLGISAPIDGLFWWDSQQILVLVAGGNVYYSISLGAPASMPGTATLTPGVRPSIVANGNKLYLASGGRIIQWDLDAGTADYIGDADAPTTVTHIAIIDTYLIAADVGTNQFYFSDPADLTTWTALGFASADDEPDNISAIYEFRNELFVFGRESVEVWQNDGQTPFSRVSNGALPVGCIAPYSIVESDNSLIFLNNRRKFVRIGGGSVADLESPYDKEELQEIVITDCCSDRWNILGKVIFVFHFPSAGITIYFNETDNNWGKFGYWNSSSGAHESFLGISYAFDPTTGKHLVGSRKNDGKLYLMSADYTTDDSNPIRMLLQSGHVNYGTSREKISRSLSFNCERGSITDSSEPVCTLRVKDNKEEWSNEIQISLGRMGEYYGQVTIPKMGRFITRQYEFACSDSVRFIFSDAREDLVVV